MKLSISKKLKLYTFSLMIPIALITGFLLIAVNNYAKRYDRIVRNITAANQYNLAFKEDIDYAMYRIVIGSASPDNLTSSNGVSDPYEAIAEARQVFTGLYDIVSSESNSRRIDRILKSFSTLEARIADIYENVNIGGKYDENQELLENSIRILTEIAQDQIQEYIFYEAKSIESLRQNIADEMRFILEINIFLFFLMLIFTVIAGNVISKSIAVPLQALCHSTFLVGEGDFTTRAEDYSGDEIKTLANSFNLMVEKISGLIEDIKIEQRDKQAAELKLLQAQINPHFLYNTLDAIAWFAEGGEKQKVVEMVDSLSSFFRTSLSKGQDIVPLREEEKHISSYLRIQQFRYSDILSYEINIPDDLGEFRILKLTLQPIVENALYHGIKNKRGGGKIFVSAKAENDMLILKIEDNGIGMHADRLEQVRSMIEGRWEDLGQNGFGISNVAKRINLNYEQHASIAVESEYLKGTCFTIALPLESLKKEHTLFQRNHTINMIAR